MVVEIPKRWEVWSPPAVKNERQTDECRMNADVEVECRMIDDIHML
jgi:hypothetical protein